MTDELKPCPFCGSNRIELRNGGGANGAHVDCIECGLQAPTETGVTIYDAVKYWQSRATE